MSGEPGPGEDGFIHSLTHSFAPQMSVGPSCGQGNFLAGDTDNTQGHTGSDDKYGEDRGDVSLYYRLNNDGEAWSHRGWGGGAGKLC